MAKVTPMAEPDGPLKLASKLAKTSLLALNNPLMLAEIRKSWPKT